MVKEMVDESNTVKNNNDDYIFPIKEKFKLSEKFLEQYKGKQPEWGPLAYTTYMRTYSRNIEMPNGNLRKEQWWETIKRVVEGCYTIQMNHCKNLRLYWNAHKSQKSAQEMYRLMFEMKFLPPGRGLWCMGTDVIYKKGSGALNNCMFVSTEDLQFDFSGPFCTLADFSFLGVGCGFDTEGAGKVKIQTPKTADYIFTVDDSREGWVECMRLVLDAYVGKAKLPKEIDYTKIRPEGAILKSFGGICPGYKPLETCMSEMKQVLDKLIDQEITSVAIIDIMNIIGKSVVSGGIRRSSELSLGKSDDKDYLEMKDYNKYPELLKQWRWASNNSVLSEIGMDYTNLAKQTSVNGEPGYVYLDNMRKYGRLKDGITNVDSKVKGCNPSLRYGTKVHTTDGIFEIQKLQDKEFSIINIDGKKSKAKCFLSGKNKQLYKIKLEGNHEYYCTAEHKWPVYEKNQSSGVISKNWKKKLTIEIKPGEYFPIQHIDTLYDSNNGTRDDGFLIGWNLGDGWQTTRKDNNKKQIGFMVSEEDRQYNIDNILIKILNEYGVNTNFIDKNEININNSSIRSLFEKFNVKNKSEGLPESVWNNSSEEFRKGLLDGLFSSDGCCSDRIMLTTAYKKLADDVSELLGFYGIKNSIKSRIIKGKDASFPNGKIYDRDYISYIVSINRSIENMNHFKSIVGYLTHVKKNNQIQTLINKSKHMPRVKKIISVEETDLFEDVWDITVYDELHCFNLSQCITGNCAEQSLESYELCCLVETFPSKHNTWEEYYHTLKYAYLYGKSVTLIPTHDSRSNQVMLRNRRIGLSMSGITDAIVKHGRRNFLENFCDKGYQRVRELDKKYSDWFCVPESIKVTSVKPSGCRTKESITTTDNGILTLEELLENHLEDDQWCDISDKNIYVIQDNVKNKITKTYKNGLSEIYKIKLNNNIELECTPNHKWFVKQHYVSKHHSYRDINLWKETETLEIGNILEVNLNIYNSENNYKFKSIEQPLTLIGNRGNLDVTFPEYMNEDLAWFFGVLWGDGSMSKSKHRLRFIDNENIIHLYKCQEILKKYFNIDSEIKPASGERKALVLEIGSRWLWEWLLKNGIYKTKKNNEMPNIPKCIRQSSKNDIIAFYSGLIDSDGCVSQINRNDKLINLVSIATAYDEFAKHIQNVALSVGLVFGRSLNCAGANKQKEKHIWLMQLATNSLQSSFDILSKHSIKLSNVNGGECIVNKQSGTGTLILGKIIGIEHLDEQKETFDIEVENEHWYYAGGIKSHNTVSLVAEVSPGLHFPHSQYYIRRIELQNGDPLISCIKDSGYNVVESVYKKGTSVVAEFPIKVENYLKGKDEASIWEQMNLLTDIQTYWSDNCCSITVTFNKDEAPLIKDVLETYEDRLKTVSFLPLSDHGYEQAPYETIDENTYNEMISKIVKPLDFSNIVVESKLEIEKEKFCDGTSCSI